MPAPLFLWSSLSTHSHFIFVVSLFAFAIIHIVELLEGPTTNPINFPRKLHKNKQLSEWLSTSNEHGGLLLLLHWWQKRRRT
jgi:hypothetical protein